MKKNKLEHFNEMHKDEYLKWHPEYVGLSDEELIQTYKDRINENNTKKKKSLKEHIEFFSDAIIAVIITIMVLEIPIPGHEQSYFQVLNSIATYFVSFFIVAYFWRSHHRILQRVDQVNDTVLLTNFVFIAFLSLIPLFTKWMMEDASGFAVANYGLVYLLVFLSLNVLDYLIFKEEKINLNPFFDKIFRIKTIGLIIINLIIIAFSYYHPSIGRWWYALMPILSLFLIKQEDINFID